MINRFYKYYRINHLHQFKILKEFKIINTFYHFFLKKIIKMIYHLKEMQIYKMIFTFKVIE